MSRDLVSVVIPAFNARATVAETLRSVQQQTYRQLEIIVVDDGSTDGTGELVAGIARDDARIRVIRQPNGGLARARNSGLRTACGAFIALVDADDLWHPDKIGLQVALMQTAASQPGMVYCWSWWIDERSRTLPNRYNASLFRGRVPGLFALRNFLGNGSTALFRAAAVRTVGLFDETMPTGCEDLDYYMRTAEAFPIDLVPQVLTGYRVHRRSMSSNWAEMWPSLTYALSRAQARNPTMPECVFRWGKARYLAARSGRCAEARHWRAMISLFARATWLDPCILLSLRPRKALSIVRRPATTVPGGARDAFLPPPAWLAAFEPAPPPWLDRRRHAFAAAFSPPAGAPGTPTGR